MANLFKGYVPSIDKRPIGSLKNSKDWSQVPIDDHDYVGILKDNIIQIDFDDEESSKIALKIVNDYKLKCDILKTSRGVHLYFITDNFTDRQSVGLYDAIGLRSDIGLGSNVRAVPLRTTKKETSERIINGENVQCVVDKTVTREWIQTYSELDVIPPYFRPIGNKDFGLKKVIVEINYYTLIFWFCKVKTFPKMKSEKR